jgi:phospholipase C
MDRRTFLKAALGGTGMALGAGQLARAADLTNLALPSLGQTLHPSRTPVEHIVVLMMENRSVDHYLGWYRAENDDFDAIQTASFPNADGSAMVPTGNWGAAGRGNYHGRTHPDPSHGWEGGRHERNGGACDGWLHTETGNDEFALSYYDAADLPVWSQLVRGWQAYDRWFCSVLGPTQPNRFYLHSAQSGGRKNNKLPPELVADDLEAGRPPGDYSHGWSWPTIWSLLEQKGITAAYYYCNLPEILFWGERHIAHARHISEYYAAAEAGVLPQVSFIDPWFIGPEGVSNDDHPHADLRLGQAFISDVVEAFVNSAVYRKGALVVTYDEWGGFWDHVDPPRVADDLATDHDPGGLDDFGQLGFRVPSTIVSPWTAKRSGRRGNRVDHRVYEHTSIIKFIADNWGLGYLNTRHRETNSIESAFRRFREYQPEVEFTPYDLPPDLLLQLTTAPYTEQAPASPAAQSDLHRLADMGWFDGLPIRTDWRFEDSFSRSGIRVG